MIKINLLPEDKRKQGTPIVKVLHLGTYAILGLALLVWGYQLGMLQLDKGNLTQVNDGLAEMKLWQQRFDENLNFNGEINRRARVVKEVSSKGILWSNTLAELGNVTPYGCWITQVSQTDGKTGKIQINGYGLKMENILSFLHNLQQDPRIHSVSMGETRHTKINAASAIAYNISFVKGGKPDAQQ